MSEIPNCSETCPCRCKTEIPESGDKDWLEVEIVGDASMLGRYFETGAYRDTDEGKYDFEGFFSPKVLERRAEYMHKHRLQSDGRLRASDNWQKGIPFDQYMKSAWRHFFEWWYLHRDGALTDREFIEDAICALMFNCEGYLHELLKEEDS